MKKIFMKKINVSMLPAKEKVGKQNIFTYKDIYNISMTLINAKIKNNLVPSNIAKSNISIFNYLTFKNQNNLLKENFLETIENKSTTVANSLVLPKKLDPIFYPYKKSKTTFLSIIKNFRKFLQPFNNTLNSAIFIAIVLLSLLYVLYQILGMCSEEEKRKEIEKRNAFLDEEYRLAKAREEAEKQHMLPTRLYLYLIGLYIYLKKVIRKLTRRMLKTLEDLGFDMNAIYFLISILFLGFSLRMIFKFIYKVIINYIKYRADMAEKAYLRSAIEGARIYKSLEKLDPLPPKTQQEKIDLISELLEGDYYVPVIELVERIAGDKYKDFLDNLPTVTELVEDFIYECHAEHPATDVDKWYNEYIKGEPRFPWSLLAYAILKFRSRPKN